MTYLSKFGLLLILVSPSGVATTLLDKLSLCAKSDDNLQRLACYDAVVDKNINNQSEPHEVKHRVPVNVATTEKENSDNQQQAKFGQENKQRSESLINQIQAAVIKIKKAPYGKLVITLDNGQVWRQTDSTLLRLRDGDVVIIERGALDSFFIGKESANKRIRAKRVK